MIQNLSWSITNLFIRRNEIPDEDGEVYAFGFECILSTAIQIIILTITGLIFRCLVEITLYSFFFTRIKGYIGGYHAKTHFTCMSGYTAMALIIVRICKSLPYLWWVSIIFTAIGFILVLTLAPIQHVNNPKTDEEMVVARKKAVLVATVIVIVLCGMLFTSFNRYTIFAAAGFFIATLSLPVPTKFYM